MHGGKLFACVCLCDSLYCTTHKSNQQSYQHTTKQQINDTLLTSVVVIDFDS
eukprot:m.62191 g.62191  ORF g.62191 m.62191 type:complete len:52 (-) comp23103_c0_seq2:26-181(-)